MTDRGPESSPQGPDGTCLFVIGMHRSGTSAVTGMLARLDIGVPPRQDLVGDTTFNERGHFESKSLTRVDNQLLRTLGGTWSAPPTMEPDWELQPAIVALRRGAADAFAAEFLLPRWLYRHHIRSQGWTVSGNLLIYRDGLEVAHSLRTRNQINLTHGLALWQRYVRSSCANLAGVPTFVTEYRRLVEDPASSCHELVRFLADVGIGIEPGRERLAIESLDAGLRHEGSSLVGPAGIDADPREVLATLRGLDGAHHPWQSPDLGAEPEWVDDVLASQRQYEVLVNAWWRLRGTRHSSLSAEGDDA